jgi:AraC-like DNA-binding protein
MGERLRSVQTVHAKQSGSVSMVNSHSTLPSGMPIARRGLCMLAQPCLRQPQHANRFRFLEATILLVSSGKLTLDNGEAESCLEGPSTLMAVAQNVCADLQKMPGGPDLEFRSLFLALSPEVIREFYKRYEQENSALSPVSYCCELPLDDDLSETLNHCLNGLDASRVSDRVLRHRLVGLLLALAERGILFSRPAHQTVGDLLQSLLSDAPGHQWTTAKAGRKLAMSEATLRRRLAAENLRFESLLLEVRMHHAMALLQTTGWSIPQVAEACGYQAHSRFSLRFRERFGCSPSHVR